MTKPANTIKLLAITVARDDISYHKQAELACAGGADMIQLRDKSLGRAQLVKLAKELQAICKSFNALFTLNDDPEIAAEAGCDGVHIGQDDMPYEKARKFLPCGIIGVSAQNIGEAAKAAAIGADYIGFGPIFTTPSKEGPLGIGIGALREFAGKTTKPVIAIGGIDESNAQEIIRAGADGIAVIRAVCGAGDIKEAAKKMKELIIEAGTK